MKYSQTLAFIETQKRESEDISSTNLKYDPEIFSTNLRHMKFFNSKQIELSPQLPERPGDEAIWENHFSEFQ